MTKDEMQIEIDRLVESNGEMARIVEESAAKLDEATEMLMKSAESNIRTKKDLGLAGEVIRSLAELNCNAFDRQP